MMVGSVGVANQVRFLMHLQGCWVASGHVAASLEKRGRLCLGGREHETMLENKLDIAKI